MAALGVVLALLIRSAPADTYTQIGIVLLVALASKNAILIVEFASEERRNGQSIRDAAVNAARLRFRAILMTAFSSILGFLPLLIATGAGAASRQAVGNAVVGGMMAATVFSLLFVPTFFVVFQRLAEWRSVETASATGSTGETVSMEPPTTVNQTDEATRTSEPDMSPKQSGPSDAKPD